MGRDKKSAVLKQEVIELIALLSAQQLLLPVGWGRLLIGLRFPLWSGEFPQGSSPALQHSLSLSFQDLFASVTYPLSSNFSFVEFEQGESPKDWHQAWEVGYSGNLFK